MRISKLDSLFGGKLNFFAVCYVIWFNCDFMNGCNILFKDVKFISGKFLLPTALVIYFCWNEWDLVYLNFVHDFLNT